MVIYNFYNITSQAFTQYQDGTRSSLITQVNGLPKIGDTAILHVQHTERTTQENFIRLDQEGNIRIIQEDSTIQPDNILFFQIRSLIKLDNLTSDSNMFVLQF